jgi:hypothetical protein
VQSLCVVVSCVLDPLLIGWFQKNYGNGGLGVAVAAGVSEVLMVGAAIYLSPKGLLNRALGVSIVRAAGAGLAMGLVAFLLRGFSSFIGAPLAVIAYGLALWAVGGLTRAQLETFRAAFRRKRTQPVET